MEDKSSFTFYPLLNQDRREKMVNYMDEEELSRLEKTRKAKSQRRKAKEKNSMKKKGKLSKKKSSQEATH
jgi:hypothetical protein